MQDGYRVKYGIKIPPLLDTRGKPVAPMPDWLIERNILKDYENARARFPQIMPRWEHFKLFCNYIWGDPDNTRFFFEWNPNACKILERYHQHRYLAIAGHASSSKSETMALISVAEFLIDPENTKVLVTSTDAKSAKGKIWGSIENCWNVAEKFYENWNAKFEERGIKNACFIPGRLISSESIIRAWDGDKVNNKRGIELIAAEVGRSKEASEKMQGYHAQGLILMADELATITPAVLETATTNMRMKGNFKMVGGFNPDGYYDPGGVMSKPAAGWSTITDQSEEWETIIEPQGIKGYCIRFDGEKSPNVLAGRNIWRGLLTLDQLNAFRASEGGEKSKGYWKMVRGYWCPTGSQEAIYSEADIVQYGADKPVTTWIDRPQLVAGLDPSFSHGGDKAILVIGKVGKAVNPSTGEIQTVFERVETIVLDNDITDTSISKDEWIIKLVKPKLLQYGIKSQDLAIDTTGGGASFSSLVRRDIGTGFLDVIFNSSPSDMRFSASDKRTGKERFVNMVSEIWYVGKELIRSGQLRNLDPDTVTEMCARTYDDKAGKVQVEPKDKMKKRTGGKKSPDRSDALFLAVHLARLRHGLSSTEKAAKRHTEQEQIPPHLRLQYKEMQQLNKWNPEKRRASFADLAQSVGSWAGAGWAD